MTISGAMTYNRYRVRRNTTEPGFSFEARNDQVSQTLLIPGLSRLNPNDLFRNGQPGGWADPYDLTRMWIDDAGTTPATIASLGTGIGRVITKGNAITLTQANAADRPVWGRHPVSGIRNLIEWSEDVSNAVWVKNNVSVAADGEFWRITVTSVNVLQGVQSSSVAAANHAGTVSYRVTFKKETTAASVQVYLRETLGAGTLFGNANINLVTGVSSEGTVVDLGDRWQLTRTVTSVSGPVALGLRRNSEAVGFAFSVGRAMVVAGGAALLDPYQRVTNRFDITEVGVPSLYYFSGNGVNQRWSSNATVNFSTTDKVTVWAGLRKLSDANRAMVVELGPTTTDGVFSLEAPEATANTFGFRSVGTTARFAATSASYASPTTRAVVGVGNTSAPLARVIVGTEEVSVTATQGAGNYRNDTLHVFSRGGSSLFYNGLLYSLIIAGDNYDSRTIQRFSDWLLKPRRLITA